MSVESDAPLGSIERAYADGFGAMRDTLAAKDAEIDRLVFEYERADAAAKRLGAKWKEATAEVGRLRALIKNAADRIDSPTRVPRVVMVRELRAALVGSDGQRE